MPCLRLMLGELPFEQQRRTDRDNQRDDLYPPLLNILRTHALFVPHACGVRASAEVLRPHGVLEYQMSTGLQLR